MMREIDPQARKTRCFESGPSAHDLKHVVSMGFGFFFSPARCATTIHKQGKHAGSNPAISSISSRDVVSMAPELFYCILREIDPQARKKEKK